MPVIDGLTRSNFVGKGGYGWFPREGATPENGIEAFFRRGFVGSVTLSTAAFLGGECERCEGRGWHTDDSGGNIGVQRHCEDCHGTGRAAGHAAALFQAMPITAVKLSDREPSLLQGLHYWQDGYRLSDQPYRLQQEIFLLLHNGHYLGSAQIGYALRANAHAALSAALVAYGRRLAGLAAPRVSFADMFRGPDLE